MKLDRSSKGLVICLATAGLALGLAGMAFLRRKRNRTEPRLPDDPPGGEAGTGEASQPQPANPGSDLPFPAKQPNHSSPEKLPLDYFALVFALAVPFWLFGKQKLPLPMELPASALGFANPTIAASILTYRRKGWDGVKALFKRAFRTPKPKIWYLPAIFLLPAIYTLSYGIMRWTGMQLPTPNVPILMAPVFFVLFFIPALGEEVGWMGYAVEPLQNRWGALKAALILGVAWALWHVIPDIQNQKPASWIIWHRLYTIALRILIVSLYNNSGKSVLAAILLHTMDNVTVFLFPNYGSHYNPMVTGSLAWLAAGIVLLKWGPKTLARDRIATQTPSWGIRS